MNDLISRQDAIDAIVNRETTTTRGKEYLDGYAKCQHDILDIINQLPSAEPERKTGRWIDVMTEDWCTFDECKCSVCGAVECFNKGWKKFSYCPNCGAKMEV